MLQIITTCCCLWERNVVFNAPHNRHLRSVMWDASQVRIRLNLSLVHHSCSLSNMLTVNSSNELIINIQKKLIIIIAVTMLLVFMTNCVRSFICISLFLNNGWLLIIMMGSCASSKVIEAVVSDFKILDGGTNIKQWKKYTWQGSCTN